MSEELHLGSPCNVFFDPETFIYSFSTSKGVEYAIVFTDMYLFDRASTIDQIQKPFDILIENLNGGTKTSWDTDIRDTISCILEHFFEDTEKAISFTCDTGDGYGLARSRKFNQWFAISPFKEELVKKKKKILTKGRIYYTSLIYHVDNSYQEDLVKAYEEVAQQMAKP